MVIRFAGVALFLGAAMNGNGLYPYLFQCFRYLKYVDAVLVPAKSDLCRHGLCRYPAHFMHVVSKAIYVSKPR